MPSCFYDLHNISVGVMDSKAYLNCLENNRPGGNFLCKAFIILMHFSYLMWFISWVINNGLGWLYWSLFLNYKFINDANQSYFNIFKPVY